jgi:outer membrane protein assembly factor BamB
MTQDSDSQSIVRNSRIILGRETESLVRRGLRLSSELRLRSAPPVMYRGNAARTGQINVKPIDLTTRRLRCLWTAKCSEEDFGIPICVGETVFALGDFHLRAFDGGTGKERWRFSIKNQGVFHSPAAAIGLVFTASEDCLYAIEQQSGVVRWKLKIATDDKSSTGVRYAIVTDGKWLYVNVGHEQIWVWCISTVSGKVRWKSAVYLGTPNQTIPHDDFSDSFSTEDQSHYYHCGTQCGRSIGSVLVVGAGGVFASSWWDVYAFDVNTGKLLWHRNPEAEPKSFRLRPIVESVVGNTLIVRIGSRGRWVGADALTGKTQWVLRFGDPGTPLASTVGYDGKTVCRGVRNDHDNWSSTRSLLCVDAETGNTLWSCDTDMDGDPQFDQSALVFGSILIVPSNGSIELFDLSNGRHRKLELTGMPDNFHADFDLLSDVRSRDGWVEPAILLGAGDNALYLACGKSLYGLAT